LRPREPSIPFPFDLRLSTSFPPPSFPMVSFYFPPEHNNLLTLQAMLWSLSPPPQSPPYRTLSCWTVANRLLLARIISRDPKELSPTSLQSEVLLFFFPVSLLLWPLLILEVLLPMRPRKHPFFTVPPEATSHRWVLSTAVFISSSFYPLNKLTAPRREFCANNLLRFPSANFRDTRGSLPLVKGHSPLQPLFLLPPKNSSFFFSISPQA